MHVETVGPKFLHHQKRIRALGEHGASAEWQRRARPQQSPAESADGRNRMWNVTWRVLHAVSPSVRTRESARSVPSTAARQDQDTASGHLRRWPVTQEKAIQAVQARPAADRRVSAPRERPDARPSGVPPSSMAGTRCRRRSKIRNRRIRTLYATENAAKRLTEENVTLKVTPQIVRPDEIARRLGPDAVHNGLLAEADPLDAPDLSELPAEGIVLVLDQITDPHNVGAILRSAAAFGVKALVTTARHSPEATGVLAKSASGALEYVPMVTGAKSCTRAGCVAGAAVFCWSVWIAKATPILRQRPRLAARARARRRGQGPAAIDARDLRPHRTARSAGRDQEPQRIERRGARALCHDHAAECHELSAARWGVKRRVSYGRDRTVIAGDGHNADAGRKQRDDKPPQRWPPTYG